MVNPEAVRVAERYARRSAQQNSRYDSLEPAVWHSFQERQRALIGFLSRYAPAPLGSLQVLEIGCGPGGNLLELLRLGFDPAKLTANELLPDRVAAARRNLPDACRIVAGDATTLDFADGTFDIVYQSTVFTSLLDSDFKRTLAERMWRWVKPGGAVLWYDFVYDNPSNPDVRGVPIKEVRTLFPAGDIRVRRVTLAPPISRRVSRIHPFAYHLFNAIPLLRTHVLCWIRKDTRAA